MSGLVIFLYDKLGMTRAERNIRYKAHDSLMILK